MLYVILGQDTENSLENRLATRASHLDRLELLQKQGRLLLAGPMPAIDANDPGGAGYTGSLIVAEFDCLEDAEQWANNDPYLLAGVYANVSVRPFKKVLP